MSNAKIKVCIDAGHSGLSNRSPAVPEYYESVVMWRLQVYLKDALEALGLEVITTREALDSKVNLWDRGQKSKGCDLFLSLHSNAVGSTTNESVDRPVVLCYSEDGEMSIDDVSRELGYKLVKVIESTMTTDQIGNIALKKADWDRNEDGILNDEWYGVLDSAKRAGTVGMILEHSFHTQTRATNWLLDDNNLRKMAQAEANAIAEYYGVAPRLQVSSEITKEVTSIAETGDNPSPWHKDATEFCKEKGFFSGDGNGNYGWQQGITREAVAQLIYNILSK